MRSFVERMSSRKFLAALAVQVASVVALFFPGREETIQAAAVQIASLLTMLLAALGYGRIESAVDRDSAAGPSSPAE